VNGRSIRFRDHAEDLFDSSHALGGLIDHDNRVVQFLRLIAVTNAVIALTIPVTTLISSIDPTDGN
jgi:hypothetical protein